MLMLSLDIETTGLDPLKHGTIQLGGMIFDTSGRVMKDVELMINFENYVWTNFCLKLHYDLIKPYLFDGKEFDCTPENALGIFKAAFEQFWPASQKLIVCGKNPSFDVGFVSNLPDGKRFVRENFDHRLIDPAHWYMRSSDTKPPALQACKGRAIEEGCKAWESDAVKHTALADAYDVAHLVMWAYAEGKVPKC